MSAPQFTLYSHGAGPNGWKCALVLEELGLTYKSIILDFNKGEHKAPDFIAQNPNGRIPLLIDHHNDDFKIWESGAILIYLSEKYDTKNLLTPTDFSERMKMIQWLFFSASGQGPYFGQAAWFLLFDAVKPVAVQERYQNEILRVLGVLEIALKKSGSGYLEAKKSIADLSFVMWDIFAVNMLVKDYKNFDFEKDFPLTAAWHKDVTSTPAVQKVLADKAAL